MTDDILRAFQEIARKEFEKNVGIGELICVVKSVNEDAQSCDVFDENDSEDVIFNVRLGASFEESSCVLFPKVGSYVVVTLLDRSNAYVSNFSVVDKCVLKAENGISFDAQKGKVEVKNNLSDLKSIFESIVSFCEQATYTNSAGPTAVANNVTVLAQVKIKINNLLK
jgi:hypothetical protein